MRSFKISMTHSNEFTQAQVEYDGDNLALDSMFALHAILEYAGRHSRLTAEEILTAFTFGFKEHKKWEHESKNG